MKKVCHIACVHPRYDVRVFYKMCKSLTSYYEVSLVVADGLGDDKVDGIHIYDVGKEKNYFNRFLLSARKVYNKAVELDADIYHFHDPELLPFGKKLKQRNKRVIYDAHEYYRFVILYKEYLPKVIRKFVAAYTFNLEKKVGKIMDAVITPTEEMKQIYCTFSPNCHVIKNYDLKPKPEQERFLNQIRDIDIVHVGTVSLFRLKYMMDIIRDVKRRNESVTAYFLGVHHSLILKMNDVINSENLNENIFLIPRIPFEDVQSFLFRAKIGLNYHPYQTRFLVAIPLKVFEYMKCGLAVVSSDLPPLREFIKDNYNGVLVKSNKIGDFGEDIESLLEDKKRLKEYGRLNRQLIEDRFNWEQESQKLINLYMEILDE